MDEQSPGHHQSAAHAPDPGHQPAAPQGPRTQCQAQAPSRRPAVERRRPTVGRDEREKLDRATLTQQPIAAGQQRPGVGQRQNQSNQSARDRDRVGNRFFVQVHQRRRQHQQHQQHVAEIALVHDQVDVGREKRERRLRSAGHDQRLGGPLTFEGVQPGEQTPQASSTTSGRTQCPRPNRVDSRRKASQPTSGKRSRSVRRERPAERRTRD